MPRPHKSRKICFNPDVVYFKPTGIRIDELEEVVLTLDEFEAIRLADFEGLYQEKAAEMMNVSRQTFGNIVNSAHKKIADFVINAKALRIEGGAIEIAIENDKFFYCRNCELKFNGNDGINRPSHCPIGKESSIHEPSWKNGNLNNCHRRNRIGKGYEL
jgi:predicted DNA-binding protein (UPF0251 family)